MAIKIITGFDGSCPHYPEAVKKVSNSVFTVFPGYRKKKGISEESKDPGGSRFYTRIKNTGKKRVSVEIIADWKTEKRTVGHDLGYLRPLNGKWQMIPGVRVDDKKIKYSIVAVPGVTELALFPEYNYADCVKMVKSLRKSQVDIETIGKSREGREMWMIKLPSQNPKALNFFLQVRDHAYETAGSYCLEGIIPFLLSKESMAQYLRTKFNFFIVPMTNPDGVHNGMSRLTWEQGADMNRVYCPSKDKAHQTLIKAIDRVKPKVHMNIHNWTSKFVDGLLANDDEIAEKILHHFPDDCENYKRWMAETHKAYLKERKLKETPKENKSWKNYCKEKFDAYGVNFEFPWFSILPEQMKEKGKKALISFALAVIEEMDL